MQVIFIVAAFGLLALVVYYPGAIRDLIALIPFWIKMWTVEKHVESEKYAFGNHKRQYVVYCPANPEVVEKKHLILYFHGGGWQFGSPESFIPAAQVLSDWGFPVIMASHRRLPFSDIRQMREDISLALEQTWALMQQKGITDKKIIIGGMSSGGNLAGLLYFDKDTLDKLQVPNEKIAAAFLQAAPLDLYKMKRSPTMYLLAGRRSGKRYAEASPISYVKEKDERPVYLTHGDKDGIVQYECSISFLEKLREMGFENVKFETIAKGGHQDASIWAAVDNDTRKRLKNWLAQFQ